MAKYTATFNDNSKYHIELTVTENSYSIPNNTSEVAYSLRMYTDTSSYVGYSDYRTQVGIWINGTKVYTYDASRDFNPSAASSYSEVLKSGSVTVTHDADGSKSIVCKATVDVASGTYSPGSADTGNQTLVLTTIPQAATISGSVTATIGEQVKVSFSSPSTSFKYKLKATLGGTSSYLNSGNYITNEYYNWTPSASTWASELPTQTSRAGTLLLETYTSGGTSVGTSSSSFTMKVPSTWKPSCSLALASVNSVTFTPDNSIYVEDFSQIKATVTGGTATTGATIKSYTISGAFSKTVTTTATSTVQTSSTITSSGEKSVKVVITDSRGLTASVTKTCTFLNTSEILSTASWTGDFTIGSSKTISISRRSSSFNHKLKFTVGSASETLPSGYASTSQSWTPAATYANQFPNATSKTGTLVLTTYNSGTAIGSTSYSFTLEIPSGWVPTISTVSLAQTSDNAFINSISPPKFVAGYSKIACSISGGTATTGASIVSYTISGAMSKTVTTSSSSASETSGVITTSGTKTVNVTITDSRGKTYTKSATATYVSYSAPSVSAISYERGSYVGGVWTSSVSGTDLKIAFTGSCSLGTDGNQMDWSVNAPISDSGVNLSNGGSITRYATGIGTTTRYSVKVTLTDDVGRTTSRTITVPTLEIPLVLDNDLPAVGVGAVPQTARTLEVATGWKITQAGSDVVTKADIPFSGVRGSISGNSSVTFTLANQARGLFATTANGATTKGLWLFHETTGGGVSNSAILSASSVTITMSTGSVTVANGTSAVVYYAWIVFGGSVST